MSAAGRSAVTVEWAQAMGTVVQGVVLGVALFLALVQVLRITAEGTVFRYQGF